ncbi:DUF2911 domain-containing protein [Pseudocnuella soli]|uniref:DUF2911 domain-containing protein n=1 Tax=Pseudocnuella soli TaxID=2502779 RepID=UPI0010467751|nr:DUF2911 domain-containing protein [Pseudocnuella soli]
MKHLFLTLMLATCGAAGNAQTSASPVSLAVKMPEVDKSPMDMAYYPANYPVLKIQGKATEPLVARVIYSRPLKNDRVVFGELVEWNKIWRLGANEATEIEFYRDVKIGGKKIAKGKYTLFALPEQEQWTVILNKDTDTWGAFKYDEKKDVARIALPVQQLPAPVNAFSIMFEKGDADSIVLDIAWDNYMVAMPISLK